MKVKLTFQYKGSKTAAIRLESEWIDAKAIDLLIKDMQKTGRIHDISITDEMDREWTLKEFQKLEKKMEEEPTNPVIFFDGGFDLSSKEAGIGVVIYYNKGNETFRMRSNAKLNELESNNEAEYAALFYALELLEQLDVRHTPCLIRGDSQGVLKQLAGEWPCFEETLNNWLDKIEGKIALLGLKTQTEVIPRNQNREAHKLASQALQNNFVNSHLQIDS